VTFFWFHVVGFLDVIRMIKNIFPDSGRNLGVLAGIFLESLGDFSDFDATLLIF